MDFALRVANTAYRAGETWSRSICMYWKENGRCLPWCWPLSVKHAAHFLDLPITVDRAVSDVLAQFVDAGARATWARLRGSFDAGRLPSARLSRSA
jgi:hypothetical protein